MIVGGSGEGGEVYIHARKTEDLNFDLIHEPLIETYI